MVHKRAVALRYDRQREGAPRVVAKGAGEVANAIIETAASHTVPIIENEALVDTLIQLEVDHVIPPELYRAVAEVLAYVYRGKKQP
ncbi:flagellar biosynthesis protein [Alicyclobacillus sacchari]|uniref:Flagellar biosynthesis protein n=1 Tax=Alicyclobacillus sacchari TaxID=392010 RepID=A0A4R8LUY9_9BACL|nr:EscU/YscU/HrcU family type III secretion system export apparatus switch protein [Alicyclobacillus sacchari]TDY50456.1 flagellar biosynthesis protein [Alicyclobacillus sacchari]GMA58974.1 flagellar biosynthetic protein FlhB [Alicyclobacillus sacchari]